MVEAIKNGNYASTAAEAAGIGKSTHYQWIEKGEQGLKPYAEYEEAIKRAEAEAEMNAVKVIQAASRENWTAGAWYLERKFPDKWGRKDKLTQEISGKDGKPIEIDSKTLVMAMLGHQPLAIENEQVTIEGEQVDGSEPI
jgi:hypothetical protein